MTPSPRRLLALLLTVASLPLAQAANLEDLIFLTDLSDGEDKDQIAYQTDAKMGAWVGLNAFTGHQPGSMFTVGSLEWNQHYDDCESDEYDGDAGGTFSFSLNVDGVFSSIQETQEPQYSGDWFRVPPPDNMTENKVETTENQVCGTCPEDGVVISRFAKGELDGSTSFSGAASADLPNDWRFSRDGDVLLTAYQTNVELRQHDRTYYGKLCDDTQAGEYKFTASDYRWGRQTAKFRIKAKCPGKYTLYYSMGQYKALYHRFDILPSPGSNHYTTTGANIKIDSRQNMTRKKIEVTIGEDGWMTGEGIAFPTLPVPSSEDWGPGVGYELITRPEQAEAYGIALNRDANGNPDPNIWKDYAVVLEPTDCGCDGGSGSGGGGGGGSSGSGGSSSSGGPGSGGPRLGSVNFDANLGFLADGQSAGRITLRSPTITTALLTPAALELVGSTSTTWGSEVQPITVSGVLRQIRAPQTFVDIVTTSATSYEIRFYAANAGGTYDPQNPVATPSGTAHTTWTVASGTASGSVAFTRSSDSTPSVWEFRPVSGGGTEMLRNGISETHKRTAVDGALVEIRKTTDPVYGLVSHTRQTWRMENGKIVKKEDVQLDASGNILRGTIDDPESYYGSQTYTVGSQPVYWPSTYTYGNTTSTSTNYWDGSSDERYSTNGTIGDQDGDQQNEQLTTNNSYASPSNRNSITHVVTYSATFAHGGVNYKKEETRQATTSASYYWDSPGKRITTRWTFADGDHEGKTAWEFYPDGTATRWSYSTDTSGNSVTVQETGTPDTGSTAILYGTRSTRVEDTQGRLISSEERDIATDLVFSSEEVLELDPVHGTPTLTVRNGKEETRTYSPCCGRLETITSDGLVRTLLYDGLDREVGEDTHSVSNTFISGERNELDALGRVRKTYQRLGGTNERLIASADYDLAGNLTGTWRLGSGTVTYSETVNENGQWVKTTSRAESASGAGDALEEVTITSGNGLPLEFRRNGVLITKWYYEYADEGYSVTEIKVGDNNSENETVRSVYSMLGELVRTEYPFPQDTYTERQYDDGGRLVRETDPDGVQTLVAYSHDVDGEHVVTALDINQDGEINYGATGPSADRITKSTTTYGTRDGVTIAKTFTAQWIEDGDTPRTVSVDEMAVDGSRIWRTMLGTQTAQIVIAYDAQSGIRTETSTLPDQTQTIRTSLGDQLTSEVRKNASSGTVVSSSNQYDSYGRLWKVTDARGTTTLTYHSTDLLNTVTTPNPGTGAQVTTYAHNNRGAVTSVTHPDNTTTYRQYWADGSVKRVWGSRTYPEYRTYDRQGRLKTLTTWQDYNPASHTGSGEAVTTWNYHSQRGWLENKRYQNNTGPDYTYTAAGRPLTRTWVRTVGGQPLVTTYGNNEAGELDSIDYSDTTPDVTQVYDRAGRLKTTTDAAGLLTRSYEPASLNLSGETYSGTGFLSGRSLARTYDLRYRPQSLATDGGYSLGYGYDNAGRLEQVSQGFHSAVFGYESGTSAHHKTTIKRVGVERVRNERVLDALGRVDLVRTVIGGTNKVLRDYTLNAANQRTGVELEDGRRWAYGYDDLGQVTSAQKRLADNTTPLPGYGFGYTFDDIGNRTQTVTNSRTTTYTPDLLNRYTSRQVPGAADVRGEAHTDATVTVNTLSTTRTGKDFYREMPFTNTGAAVSDTVTIQAVRTGPPVESATEERAVFLPQTPESFGYDGDGNLTGDGRWTYVYDAENRLVGMETKTSIATAYPELKKRLTFAYDAQSRRIRKLVESWNLTLNSGAGGWETTTDLRFLYDGHNILTELNALNSNALVRSYAWGLDLSGTLQGAGGVGGLLWANTPTHTFAASADGNGNLVGWTNTATLAVAGRADYDAFGVPVMRTGVANSLPFGFSSNYTDAETGLVYYDFIRYYHPGLGRWTSKDPSGEGSGRNLYGMLDNDAVNALDYLGLWKGPHRKGKEWAVVEAEAGDTIEGLADLLRLNKTEAEKWLRNAATGKAWPTIKGATREGCRSLVPNTAYIDIGSYSWGPLGIWLVEQKADLESAWKSEGLKVKYTKRVSVEQMIKNLGTEGIYYYAYIGHGTDGSLSDIRDKREGVDEDNRGFLHAGKYTPYGIVQMYLIACNAGKKKYTWRKNVSNAGWLTTIDAPSFGILNVMFDFDDSIGGINGGD